MREGCRTGLYVEIWGLLVEIFQSGAIHGLSLHSDDFRSSPLLRISRVLIAPKRLSSGAQCRLRMQDREGLVMALLLILAGN